VEVLDRKAGHREPGHNLFFMKLQSILSINPLLHIATIGKLKYDTHSPFLVLIHFDKFDNVRVLKSIVNFAFFYRCNPVTLIEFIKIDLLKNKFETCLNLLH
jgi:hypothetical protein